MFGFRKLFFLLGLVALGFAIRRLPLLLQSLKRSREEFGRARHDEGKRPIRVVQEWPDAD